MRTQFFKIICLIALAVSLFYVPFAQAFTRGIYLTAYMATYTSKMKYFVKEAKAADIDTFVIDYAFPNTRYSKNITMIKDSGIRYVARIVVFPDGAVHSQVVSKAYREKIWKRINAAMKLGASAIQLDYIRYKKTQPWSEKNEKYIYEVIKDYRQRMKGSGVQLQIDIFGVAAHKPSRSIGQNVDLFASQLDAINPMVYPSHYEPFRYYAARPYRTVLESVSALKSQMREHPHIKIYAYIELYNYRYPMSYAAKAKYILAQLQAAHDAGADGWYAWSPQNRYKILFNVLKKYR